MSRVMRIHRDGQVVIPAGIREKFQIRRGNYLVLKLCDDGKSIEVQPAPWRCTFCGAPGAKPLVEGGAHGVCLQCCRAAAQRLMPVTAG